MRDKLEIAAYAALAVAALIGTQMALVAHIRGDHSVWDDVTATPAAVFASVDLLAVAIVAVIFMIVEGRRIGLRRWWVYIVLTFAVAIGVAFPLFLIHRKIHLRTGQIGAPSA